MAAALIPDVKSFVDALCGARCWYASAGGCTLPTFQLALGDKSPRPRQLKNPAHPQEFRENEPEFSLLVWCSWRLDGPDAPVTSSDGGEASILEGLNRLTGAKVSTASARGPGWDLRIRFSNRLTLRVFCDHVPGTPTFSTNWELSHRDRRLEVAAGSRLEFSHK